MHDTPWGKNKNARRTPGVYSIIDREYWSLYPRGRSGGDFIAGNRSAEKPSVHTPSPPHPTPSAVGVIEGREVEVDLGQRLMLALFLTPCAPRTDQTDHDLDNLVPHLTL